MEELNLQTLFTFIGFIVTIVGLYWKIRVDITELDLKIAEIQCDRKEKWAKHDEAQDKTESYNSEILNSIGAIKGDIKEIKNDLSWLKKK